MKRANYPQTPDGRYFVAKGRLWRKTNPTLPDGERRALIKRLMQARRAVMLAQTETDRQTARAQVHAAKVALGERGPVWWHDGAPDETQKHPRNSRYAAWWDGLSEQQRRAGGG